MWIRSSMNWSWVVAGVIFLASSPARANTCTWQATYGDWSIASNWGGTLPTVNDYASIANGGTVAVAQPRATCGTLSLGSANGAGNAQLTAGSLSDYVEYVGGLGMGSFTQTGGVNKTDGVYLDLSASYSLSGGSLSAGEESVGSGTCSFTQSGGTNSVGRLDLPFNGGSGSYILSGSGYMSANDEYIGGPGIGIFSQSGGTHVVGNSLYIAAENGDSATYNLSGSGNLAAALENIGESYGSGRFLQSGGTNTAGRLYVGKGVVRPTSGSYSLSGSGYLSCGTESVGNIGSGSFNQSGGTNRVATTLYLASLSGDSGTYSLQGGLLTVGAIRAGSGTGAFNFNGGTLQASGNNPNIVSGVMATYVQSGGAIIDVQGYNVTIGQNLRHDPSLGGTRDGGLTKLGSGVLILTGTDTYTGGTTVSAGSLVIANRLAIEDGTSLTVGDAAAFANSPVIGSSASVALQGNESPPAVVPEPSTVALLGACAAGLACHVWWRKRDKGNFGSGKPSNGPA